MGDWDDWEEPPKRKGCSTPAKIGLGCLVLIGLIVAGLFTIGYMLESGKIPDTAVVTGQHLREEVVQMLRDEDVLEEGETILYYYSSGIFSFREDGSLLTDRRVVRYFEDEDDQIQVVAAPYGEITDVVPEFSDDFFEDTLIAIHAVGWDGPFQLAASNEEDLDHLFVDELLERWNAAK